MLSNADESISLQHILPNQSRIKLRGIKPNANKKWWLAPIIILMLLFGLLTILAATGAAPWVYTLF